MNDNNKVKYYKTNKTTTENNKYDHGIYNICARHSYKTKQLIDVSIKFWCK